MNQPRDPDAIVAAWLDDGPVDLPAETRRAISVALRTQPRARRMANLRGLSMFPLNRLVAAAAIVLAVGGLTAFILSNRSIGPGRTPAPSVLSSPSASPQPSATASITPSASPISTAGWVPFTSARYAYSIAYPPTWSATPATRTWVFATDRPAPATDVATDHFVGGPNGNQIAVTGFATDVLPGVADDAWITSWYQADPDPNCRPLYGLTPMTIAGWDGQIAKSGCFEAQAFVFPGLSDQPLKKRVYVFTIWREGQVPLLQAFLSTVMLPVSTASPSPS